MALDSSALSSLILSNLSGGLGVVDQAQLKKFTDGIAQAVVQHIKTATVTVPAAGIVSPQGPCSGSATGTIS